MATANPNRNQRNLGPVRPGPVSVGNWARYLNATVAVWLFISAWVWPHTQVQQTNTWIVALLILAAALFAIAAPPVRFANSVLAAWLFFSTLLMRSVGASAWNNIIVSIVVFVLSFVPNMRPGAPRPTEPPMTPS